MRALGATLFSSLCLMSCIAAAAQAAPQKQHNFGTVLTNTAIKKEMTAHTTASVDATDASPAEVAAGLLWLGEHQNMGGRNCGYASSRPNLNKAFCRFGDKASSVDNRSSSAWVLYDDSGYKDRRYCISPGQRINDLHAQAWKFGDKISAIKRLSGTSCAGYPTF